jgi:long-chain acyl-CoA synthetase
MQHRPWHHSYPSEYPLEIEQDSQLALVDTIKQSFKLYGNRIAATCLNEQLSYAQLEQLSTNLAAYFHLIGLQKGDRVALMMPNSLPYLVASIGALQAGLIIVNVNPLYTPRELEHQLRDSGAKCLVIAEKLIKLFEQVAINTSIEHVLSAPLSALIDNIEAHEIDEALLQVSLQNSSSNEFQLVPFAAAIARGGREYFGLELVSASDMAFLQYTGGTTGVSKGAILTHKSVGASLKMTLLWMGPALRGEKTSIVLPLPLYHIYPLAMALLSMATGANLRLIPNPRDTTAVIEELKREPFDMFIGVNTLFNSLVDDPNLRSVDFSRTRFVIGAGASVQQAVVERWVAAGGAPITEAYGLTETSPCVTYNPPGQNGTIGIPMPSTDIRIVDDEGESVPLNIAGELLIKGPQLFAGYWNNDEETRRAFTHDGWFKTGDIVTMDEDGFMRVVDRKKDMILVSGFNVYPNEIEEVVASHPDVVECACIGVPDPRSGEAPHLFVVLRATGVTPEQIKEHCRSKLTAYKVPRHITIVEGLPKSAVGKILRRDLRHDRTDPSGPDAAQAGNAFKSS